MIKMPGIAPSFCPYGISITNPPLTKSGIGGGLAREAHVFYVILHYKGHYDDCFLPNPPYFRLRFGKLTVNASKPP